VFDDPGARLPKALDEANERAWQVLELALQQQSGLLTRINQLPSRLTDKERRELGDRLGAFLAGQPLVLPDSAAAEAALAELHRARDQDLLALDHGSRRLADEIGGLQRYSDPTALLAGAQTTVAALGTELQRHGYPGLATVISSQPPGQAPLLVSAFGWFFQRQVEGDPELARGLHMQRLKALSVAQADHFAAIGQAMTVLDGGLQDLLGDVARVQHRVDRVHDAVLDIHAEQLDAGRAFRHLYELLEPRLKALDAVQGIASPRLSYSLHNEQERGLVKQLIDEYRRLPEEQRQRLPALLDGIGKLQLGLGDIEAAEASFQRVADTAAAPTERAQGAYNAYRAALERQDWVAAQRHLE
jgi:hypothetical protein